MSDLLASVDQLSQKVGPITKDDDVALANYCLGLASAWARAYGDPSWTRFGAPEIVRWIVLEAASRGYDNPAGYELERGDMLTLQRQSIAAAGCVFTTEEQKACAAAAFLSAGNGISSIRIVRPDTMSDTNIRSGGGDSGDSSLSFG